MSSEWDLEKIVKQSVKEDIEKLLEDIKDMTFLEIVAKLAEIMWGIGYNHGYFIGHYEGKTGK